MSTFFIDSREPQTMKDIMTEAFQREGILSEVQELPEGDFKYDNIIFERKEINDFVSSIKDKRYKSQKRKLLIKQNEGYHIYVIIHGQPRDLAEENQMSKKAIAGAIASLNEYGIHTLMCNRYDYEMIFQLMYGVIRKYNEERVVEPVYVQPDNASWTVKALMCITGIGRETAENIARHIPHLSIFYRSKRGDMKRALLDIKGVGTKTADNILDEVLEVIESDKERECADKQKREQS